MHDTLFTGQSVGYNIPDVGIGNCEYCGSDIGTRPAVLNINAKSGWYNRSGYDGANGTARTEYNHTYTGRILTITPSVSYPWNISFTPNLVENKDFEKTWVYVTISPN